MFGDLTEQSQKGTQNAPLSFKHLLKKAEATTKDLELHQHQPLPSTSQSQQEQAVYVRNAHKCYGTPTNPLVVLDGFNMTVPKGSIYALLGASGCGKTTLLSCILDQRTLNSGKIWILGGKPGSKVSGVPGPRVGYMPQATALYGDFTIYETIVYYGWILGLSNKRIKERFEFLKKLLKFPDTKQLVKCCSGGEQRRVSLAAALLHKPELLILDEPTVGLDPLLRETIWEHLIDIAQGGKTTIILTTHYIEEARQAHIVGLMRGGCLLAEEPPQKIMLRYRAKTLEAVFLQLSIKQNEKRRSSTTEEATCDVMVPVNGSSVSEDMIFEDLQHKPSSNSTDQQVINSTANEDEEFTYLPEMPPQDKYDSQYSDYSPIRARHMKALVWKGLLWMMRNLSLMLCIIILPLSIIYICCVGIGRDPIGLRVAVVNYETNNSLNCNNTLACDSKQLSCIYLEYLEKRSLHLAQVYYDSEDLARESVLRGNAHASIIVRYNYSAALRVRIDDAGTTDPWDIAASEIDVFRDVSNKDIATQLKVYMYDTFQNFAQDFVATCGINRKMLKVPINWETPIYGEIIPNFTEFVLPGLLTIVIFLLAVTSTALAMLVERNEGSLERTLVTGITETELLFSHIICQFGIMASQVAMSLTCAFVIFDMTLKGSVCLITIQALLTGFFGLCYGLLISCICDRAPAAIFMTVGSVLPLMNVSGVVWPSEAVHPLIKQMVYYCPLTQATETLRSMLQRGWGLTSESVCLGMLCLSVWSIVILIVGIIVLKFKKSEIMYNVMPILINKCRTIFVCCKIN